MTDLQWVLLMGGAMCCIGGWAIVRNESKHDEITDELKGHNDRVMDKLIAIWKHIGGDE